MKSKHLLLTLLLAILAPWAAQAQETVEIGTDGGTTNNSYLPGYNYYKYSLTQQIYTADEIGMAGTINSIAFKNTGTEKTRTYNVYMLHTDKETFSNGDDWVAMSESNLVFEGQLTFTVNEWTTIELTSPFAYDGTSNLLVGVSDVTGSYSSSPHMACLVFDATSQAIRAYRDSGAYDIAAPGVTGGVLNVKNQIILDITPAGGQTCPKPDDLIANGEPTDTEFSFNIVGGSGLYNIFTKAGDGDWTNWEYEWEETTVNLTNLEGNTAYQVRVQSVCTDMTDPETGDAATSGWKTLSFTTKNPCAAPTNLAVSDITASSATLSWTAGYQETEWTVKFKKSADAWDDAVTITATSPSITLTGLDDNTTYNVQVYNCENYVSASFTTLEVCPDGMVCIGSGSATNVNLPLHNYYKYSLTEQIYTTAELGAAGAIESIDFYKAATIETVKTIDIYMVSTTKSEFTGNTDWINVTAADLVYSGTVTFADNDWTTIVLDNPFIYDGLSNVALVVDNNTGSYKSNTAFLTFSTGPTYQALYYSSDTQNLDPTNVTQSGTRTYSKNRIRVAVGEPPACLKPTGVTASNVTAHEATITWTSDAAAWEIQLNDETPVEVSDTATYTFDGLDAETTYSVKVRANCGGIYSEWANVSFTTTIACPAPTALTVTPNAYTATFTWESFAGEWDVAYATDADAEPGDFIVGTVYDTASYTVNDLELGDYYFWVRANCGDIDGFSTWAGPASVHIGYCVPAPTSVDGNGISNVTFGMGDYIVNNETPKATYADYSSQIGAVQAGVEATIAITFKTGYDYNTYVWVDLDNSLSFEADEVVCYGVSTSANPTTLTLNFTIPADQTLGDFRLRIGSADSGLGSDPANANPCYTSSYGCFQDYTLRVLEAPSCLAPTNLAINYTGGLTAEVTWEGEAETYNIDVNGEVTEGVTSPYVLDSLELATTYAVKVQADCGDDGTSEWSNPVSFTTDLCLPENQCAIYYSFTDQYDDSWNGAYINIVDATTQEVLYELTMPNVEGPYEGSFNVCDGREIQFVWVSGSYPSECGYVFTHFGTTILEKATNSTAPNAGVFFTYNVDCTPNPCTVPYELMSSNVSYNQATLSWTGYSDSYYVQYRTAVLRSGDWTEVTANTTTLDLTGLVSETTYEWQVRTDCDSIIEWSEIATFTTNPLPDAPIANLDGGYWNANETWENDSVPPAGSNVLVTGDVIIGTGYIAVADTIFFYGGSITIEDGGQLYHSNEVSVTLEMNVIGYDSGSKAEDNGGYCMFATPVYTEENEDVRTLPVDTTGFGVFDLYSFDQNFELQEWRNFKAGEFDSYELSKGYLFASAETIHPTLTGTAIATTAGYEKDLDFVEGKMLAGWNLVGNPFTCMAFVNRDFYTLNGEGDKVVPVLSGSTVEVMEGIFVEAQEEGQTVTFTPCPLEGGAIGGDPIIPGPDSNKNVVMNLTQGSNLVDRAVVRFGESNQLRKFQLNPNHTKVYIPKDGVDYAIVTADEMGEMPVSFKAENNGNFTLNFTSENVSFNYLHLIDNMTGADVDLLATPSYTFNAQTTDYASRFKLVFATGNNSNEDNFAFFSNGSFVINNDGEAMLQVVDVMGRILKSETINGSASVNMNAAPGVYMLRLVNGDNMKVQKIVVR